MISLFVKFHASILLFHMLVIKYVFNFQNALLLQNFEPETCVFSGDNNEGINSSDLNLFTMLIAPSLNPRKQVLLGLQVMIISPL